MTESMMPQIVSIVLMFLLVRASKLVNHEDPAVLLSIRAIYATSQVLLFFLCYIIFCQITKRNDLTTIKTKNNKGEEVEITVKDYDSKELNDAVRGGLMGVAFILFLHLKWNYTQPLILQSVMPLFSLFTREITQIHLLGYTIPRPFKRENLLDKFLKEMRGEEEPEEVKEKKE